HSPPPPLPLSLHDALPISAATFFDSSRQLQTAAPDQPRCAYDPKTAAPIGLLVEGARTNYVTNAIGTGLDVDGLPLGWQSQHDTDRKSTRLNSSHSQISYA